MYLIFFLTHNLSGHVEVKGVKEQAVIREIDIQKKNHHFLDMVPLKTNQE